MVLSCCAFGCTNRGGQRLGLGFHRFPFKNEGRLRSGFKRSVERIGSLRSTRGSVATILCQVIQMWKSQLSEGVICFYCRQAC